MDLQAAYKLSNNEVGIYVVCKNRGTPFHHNFPLF